MCVKWLKGLVRAGGDRVGGRRESMALVVRAVCYVILGAIVRGRGEERGLLGALRC